MKKNQSQNYKKEKRGILYSVNSWDGKFFIIIQIKMLKILRLINVKDLINQNWEIYIPPKNEVLVGGCIFLKNWIISSETSKH